jgi:hypothetical protein
MYVQRVFSLDGVGNGGSHTQQHAAFLMLTRTLERWPQPHTAGEPYVLFNEVLMGYTMKLEHNPGLYASVDVLSCTYLFCWYCMIIFYYTCGLCSTAY